MIIAYELYFRWYNCADVASEIRNSAALMKKFIYLWFFIAYRDVDFDVWLYQINIIFFK